MSASFYYRFVAYRLFCSNLPCSFQVWPDDYLIVWIYALARESFKLKLTLRLTMLIKQTIGIPVRLGLIARPNEVGRPAGQL